MENPARMSRCISYRKKRDFPSSHVSELRDFPTHGQLVSCPLGFFRNAHLRYISYLEWSSGVKLSEINDMVRGCKHQGPHGEVGRTRCPRKFARFSMEFMFCCVRKWCLNLCVQVILLFKRNSSLFGVFHQRILAKQTSSLKNIEATHRFSL